MKIKRGDIYWIEQSKDRPAVGHMQHPGRPGIVVSNDANNACAYTLEIVYLTGKPKKDLPTHCAIKSAPKPGTALCEQVTTVSTEQIREYIGHCTDAEMADLDRCIAISLGLRDPEEEEETEGSCEPVAPHPFEMDDKETMAEEIDELMKELAIAIAQKEMMQEMYEGLLTKAMDR